MKNLTLGADVAVIGGGLAGMLATLRLAREGVKVLLIDNTLPQALDSLGGFARFSGAKFSLPPAGMGLVPVAGNLERLNEVILETLVVLGLDGYITSESIDSHSEEVAGFAYRRYHSILLTPDQIGALLDRLTAEVSKVATVIRGKAVGLSRDGDRWRIVLDLSGGESELSIDTKTVFYAAGRLSEGLLLRAGARPLEGKGLDIGVRLEFADKSAINKLRQLGPDAKILRGKCRTFCLNSPGEIYRYPFKSISIPGGVVADGSLAKANVGILLRVGNKEQRLHEIIESASIVHDELLMESMRFRKKSEGVGMPLVLAKVFGVDEIEVLTEFVEELAFLQLIDTNQPHRIHMPLLDWHWHTFASPNSHLTSLPGIFALGDSSGYARGLLQASVSGWLAAEEYLCST